jgi:Zn-dependent peptidase ImmA (M78 family)/predicted secreted protein
MNRRDAILSGALAATRLHQQSRTEEQLTLTRAPVDVFGALLRKETAVLFRPLQGLLGACLSDPARGVIISTQRPLSVQRFTGAHELGHIMLHHNFSLDGEEILQRPESLGETAEIQANAFASEFLIPRWLPIIHGRAQGWNRESLKNPATVYQLALRMGASYDATCIALRKHNAVDAQTLAILHAVEPKTIKRRLIPGYQPSNWHRDVWLLTERDEGAVIEGQPDDLFLFRLNEKSGSGYLWDITELKKRGFVILQDSRNITEQSDAQATTIGGSVERIITAQSENPAAGELLLALRRPWQKSGDAAEKLHFTYDLRGKEQGLPRTLRPQLHAA